MFRRIRIRAGSAHFYPYNTPSVLLKYTRYAFPFQQVAVLVVVTTTSYADRHNTPSLDGFMARPEDCGIPPFHS